MPAYFRNVPDFEYVSRTADTKQISEYQKVKNQESARVFIWS